MSMKETILPDLDNGYSQDPKIRGLQMSEKHLIATRSRLLNELDRVNMALFITRLELGDLFTPPLPETLQQRIAQRGDY